MELTLNVHIVGLDEVMLGLTEAPLKMDHALASAMRKSVRGLRTEAIALTPVGLSDWGSGGHQGGRLRRSIGGKFEDLGGSAFLGAVGARTVAPPYGNSGMVAEEWAPYAVIIEHGAGAHEIRARRTKVLFGPPPRGGLRHPVKRVHHPGVTGQHMLRDALREHKHAIVDNFRDAIERVLNSIRGA